jgi:general secretion pathway protein D
MKQWGDQVATTKKSKGFGFFAFGRLGGACVISFLLMSCTVIESAQESTVADAEDAAGEAASAFQSAPLVTHLSSSAADLALVSLEEDHRAEAVIYRGNGKQVKLPEARKPINLLGDDVSLNFEQAPLSEVMHAIMNDILGLDYIVDHPVKGEVTLRTRTPVPRDQLLGILESLLQSNGALMIRSKDNRFLITGSQNGAGLSSGVTGSNIPGTGYSTMIIPLQYISASNMADILKPVAKESAFVRVDNARNLIMMRGTGRQQQGWLEMVGTFDVDMLAGMSVGLFPLENTSVDEMALAIDGLLGDNGGGNKKEDTNFSHLVRIIPIERLNSLLVVTPRAHYLEKVGTWISRLDGEPDSKFEKRLYVYPVQNTTASRLADLLSSIYTGSTSGGSRPSNNNSNDRSSVAPGLNQESIGSSSGSSGGGISAGLGNFVNGDDSGSGGSSQFMIDDVRVVADDENNALMIYATGKEYKKIVVALEDLDIVATQVIIEASILEVTLSDEMRYGVEWAFKNSLGNSYDGAGLLSAAAGGPPSAAAGFSYTITNSIGDISAVLNALSSQSLLNVISTPSVMVLDNHTAYIHVGDQVPIFSAQTTTDGGTISQSVEYKDTGVKLSVKPSVNAGGLVTMDVEQSVTDVGEIDAATGQRAFLERNINSRVAVRSNESVVLGGLIRENASSGSTGIPFLHKIPLIGALFGTNNESDRRTELLVIITPRAIYDESELRDVSQEMRSRIRNMDLIEAQPN